ncbi:hypothetical protein Y900_027300 [Mycolicibacterium aromaticivorans JS19b1 = JCM 16368]|uniref:MgtC/SapB/SrpB/YhiD N-terminal domain-containing protein n=1 Tax=Mycolicibacterium aromaticivorans JS19b1 = JCM 16368 TaxID=1440774 RepID=A0A064CBF7_9MYCO|nr:MgtC/SapB family protein [Mycolicibacterium aromaticivorans]KDE97011.1 hypothetical protein Y900_027300 [Mycolicibacterium aromaticivorans JS19b1 = JCM 16368]
MTEFDLILLARAALAAALGFVIGWERETCGSPAGDRTNALVGLGAAVFTALALDLFPQETGRVIAGVATRVRFLGAGVILRQSTGEVRGLTTAAGIWSVAALGVVVGAGRYWTGLILAALILLILVWEEIPGLARIGYNKRRAAQRRTESGQDPP